MTIYKGGLKRASDSELFFFNQDFPVIDEKHSATHAITTIKTSASSLQRLTDITQLPEMREPNPWHKADLFDPIHFANTMFEPTIKAIAPPTDFHSGQFTVSLTHRDGEQVQLSIYDNSVNKESTHAPTDSKGVLLFQTIKNTSFIQSGNHHLNIKDQRGSYDITRDIREESKYQTIDYFEQLNDQSIIMQGRLLRHKFDDQDHLTRYRLCIHARPDGQIDINIRASDGNFIALDFKSNPEEKIFGFGEQYSHINLKGHNVPILVQEQGIGRGHRFITPLVNLFSNGSGGSDTSTSFPMPHFMTSQNRGLYLLDKAYSEFNLKHPNKISILFFDNNMTARLNHFQTPLDHIETFTKFTGRMLMPPEWTHNGAVMYINDDEVKNNQTLDRLLKAGVKIAAIWDQHWSGIRKTAVGSQVWWDWKPDPMRRSNLNERIAALKAQNIRYLAYINPMIVDREAEESRSKKLPLQPNPLYETQYQAANPVIDAPIKAEIPTSSDAAPYSTCAANDGYSGYVDPELGECVPVKDSLYKIALRNNYLVKKNGKIARPANTTFSAGLIDLTNPEAREWFKSIIKSELLDRGVAGWMLDYGESFPFDATLCCGLNPAEQHNVFPELLGQVNYEVIHEANKQDEILNFLRAGFTKSPGFTPAFWAADQMTIGPGPDGMESAMVALISSGLSGIAINHSDTGGYTSISMKTPFGVLGWARKPWLLSRWMEMNMFTSLLRFHPGLQPNNNSQAFHPEMVPTLKRATDIYCALSDYRRDRFVEANEKGWPVVRHMMLHYFEDPKTHDLQNQFMFGRDFIVAPVFKESQTTVSAYLPKDQWVHLWTGKAFDCSQSGQKVNVDAPLGQPGVFYLKGSKTGEKLRNLVVRGEI